MKPFALILTSILCLFLFNYSPAQSSADHETNGLLYTLDKNHSLMDFTARHVGFGRVRGTFNDYRASMFFVPGDLTSSSVSATIEVASLDTQNPGRDDHLKEVFFQVKEYPYIHFQSSAIIENGDGHTMFGDLTIKDVTKKIELPLEVITLEGVDQWENKRVVLETSLTIDRNDYNVIYDSEFWDGIVSDEIKIDISFGGSHYNALNSIFPWRKSSIGTFVKNNTPKIGIDATLNQVHSFHQSDTTDFNFGISHLYRAGLALAQGGDSAAGIKVLEFTIELHKAEGDAVDLGDLYATIAEIYFQEQQHEAASNAVKAALLADPFNPAALEFKRRLPVTGR